MKRYLTIGLAAVLAAVSCGPKAVAPRPAVPLVYSIAADSTGAARLVRSAGSQGADGAIAIIGEPADAILLARRFQSVDWVDNVDGDADRDSLPDFAGETFQAIMDANNAPYARFWKSAQGMPDSLRYLVLDSLREAAVETALFAWDSTCYSTAQDLSQRLRKIPAKILIYTSPLQAEWGLFDVDTLRQLCGGTSVILSPMDILLEKAYGDGARRIGVWTSRDIRSSGAWETVFARKNWADASLTVITPESALDVRTRLRSFLRQYQAGGKPLDALLLDDYSVDPVPLQSELTMIRRAGTEEDAAFDRMLSRQFTILDPVTTTIGYTYQFLREQYLFTHKIARPAVRYYETVESGSGNPVLIETDANYALTTYVPNLD